MKNTVKIIRSILQRAKKYLSALIYRFIRAIIQENLMHDMPILSFYNKKYHTFFGYYDLSPFNNDSTKILSMRLLKSNKDKKNPLIDLGYFLVEDGEHFYKIGSTSTWCWQMGCRLQWYPEEEDNYILYNTIVDSSYGAIVKDIHTNNTVENFKFPIYDLSTKSKVGLFLNFSRLGRLRPGYGYTNFPDKTKNILAPIDDGIWIADLQSKKIELLLNLRYLSEYDQRYTMVNAEHYINHISLSPSGNNFLFFHLWKKNNIENSRLIISDISGKIKNIFNFDGKVSHYSWKNEEQIIITVYLFIGLYRYFMINISTMELIEFYPELFLEDGHPSFSSDSEVLLTDTYPDMFGELSLILFNTKSKEKKILGKFKQNMFRYYNETRCDLHPRWNSSSSSICFDSVHQGNRGLYIVNLDYNK